MTAATSNGRFTVATAYQLQLMDGDTSCKRQWQNIWRLKGQQRGNFLLWQARLDRLPTVVAL